MTDSTREALVGLIAECERANSKTVNQIGMGLIDLNAIDRAKAALATPEQAPAVQAGALDEREAFEQWAWANGFNTHRDETEKYRDYHRATTRFAWQAWQARAAIAQRAALATTPSVQAEQPAERYSIDADPLGIRARVADAIRGVLMLGAQNTAQAPDGHWLAEFWHMARNERSSAAPWGQAEDAQRLDAERYRVLRRNTGAEMVLSNTPGAEHTMILRINITGCERTNASGAVDFPATLDAALDDERRIQAVWAARADARKGEAS